MRPQLRVSPITAALSGLLFGFHGAALSRALSVYAQQLDEAFSRRAMLLVPVFLSLGIAGYFALAFEPPLALGITLAALSGAGLIHAWRRTTCLPLLRWAVAALFVTAFGFLTAEVRARLVYAPALAHSLEFVALTGTVTGVNPLTEREAQIVIAPSQISGLSPNNLPAFVRVRVRGLTVMPRAGQTVYMPVMLLPPPSPAVPGGFDFARQAYFFRLGAVGFATGKPVFSHAGKAFSFPRRVGFALANLRADIAGRILTVLPGDKGALANALITGLRGAIPEEWIDDLRDSGLAHLLSISGVHMALFAGTVFFIARLVLSFFPPLALRWSVKKWAALLALLSAFGYLLISGGEVATQRSFIMIALIFSAVLADRAALTLRNVALAATIILVVMPESLMQVSFQMSFAAVAMLVAGWEWARQRGTSLSSAGGGFLARLQGYVLGIAATSLFAGMATAPFGAYHFNRITGYTILADFIATPAMAFLVMPAAFATLVCMPFGMEAWPLKAMAFGNDLITATAAQVAALPGAVRYVPSTPPLILVLNVLGGLFLILVPGRTRYLGFFGPVIAIVLCAFVTQPDLYVSREGRNFAIRGTDGRLILYSGRADRYSAEQWLRRDGDPRTPTDAVEKSANRGRASVGAVLVCDKLGCIHRRTDGRVIAYIKERAALGDDCLQADILIAPFSLRPYCRGPSLIIDGRALKERGAHALFFRKETIDVKTVEGLRGRRYWSGFTDQGRFSNGGTGR
jgi:competence protein ComEC